MSLFLKGLFGMTEKDGGAKNERSYNGDGVEYQSGMDTIAYHERPLEDLVRQFQVQRTSFRNLPIMVQKLHDNNDLQISLISKLIQERRELASQNKRLMEEKIKFTGKMESQSREISELKNEVMYLKQRMNSSQYYIAQPHCEMKLAASHFNNPPSPRKIRYIPKKRPQVHVYFFSPQRDQVPPISDITSRLAEALSQQDIELVTDTISETPVPDDARPAILLCINVSRVGTDVSNALKDLKADCNVAVVVLHHKDIHVLPKLSSVKSLTGREFQNLGTIVDMAFWKEKGLHQCDMNQLAIHKLSQFLQMFILPDN